MDRARHLVSATYIFVTVIPGTSRFIKCQDLLVLLWESGGQGAGIIIIIFAVLIYLFIHSSTQHIYNDQAWARSSGVAEARVWGLPA